MAETQLSKSIASAIESLGYEVVRIQSGTRSGGRIFSCAVCGKECRAMPARTGAKYCSVVCQRQGREGANAKRKRAYLLRALLRQASRLQIAADKEMRAARPRQSKRETVTCLDCGKVRHCSPSWRPLRCRPCSLKHRAGSENSNWQGGKKSDGAKFRNSKEYATWRTSVFVRDDYTCVTCGQRGGVLHADHIKPFAYHPDLRLELSNGRTLCLACHKKTSTYLAGALRGRGKRQLATCQAGDQ